MINIPPLRTRRINARMREISSGAAIRLAGIHPHQHEYATTEFLRAVIESADTPTALHVADPRMWTVQERTLAVCHYIAATAPNGQADFAVGEGRLTDYMLTQQDYKEGVDLGEACEDKWRMVPMTGMAAEVIERIAGEVPNVPDGRVHWLIGSMAAQLVRVGKDEPAPVGDAAYADWLKARMTVFADFPESDFVVLAQLRATGAGQLVHLFNSDIGDFADDSQTLRSGMLAYPAQGDGEGVVGLPAARFPVDVCLSDLAKRLGKPVPQFDS